MFFREHEGPLRVLAISAHPDDETFGAGGTLLRHTQQGDELYICVVTKAYSPDWSESEIEIARKEAEEAHDGLGAAEVTYLGYPTARLNTIPYKEINDAIRTVIERYKPDIIYTPSPGDLHKDHRIVAEAAAVSIRPTWGMPHRTLVYYEVLSSSEWGRIFLGGSFMPNLYVDIGGVLDRKIEIAGCFKQEIREYPHPRSLEGVSILAKARGLEVGLEAAEAFHAALRVEL